jgi:hypothetical protein
MGVLQGLASNGEYLYAAWKGEPGDDRIFYSRWNGHGNWASAGTIPGNTSAGPALAVSNNGSLYAAWKGEWSDPRVFFSKFNGTKWDGQTQILNAYSDTGPALSSLGQSLGGQLVAAWKNVFNQNLYFSKFDGNQWSTPSQIGGVASSVGPSLATFSNGKVYAIWKGEGSDQRLWFASYDGTNWSGQAQVPNVGTSVGASLAAIGSKLYAVWKGESDENLYYASFDGMTWSGQTQIADSGSSVGAAISEFGGNLYAMAKGKGSDVSLYNAEWNSSNGSWSTWTNEIPGNTGPDPTTLLAAPGGGNVNYLLADSKGAALKGTTVTIIVAEDIVTDSAKAYSFQINCNSPTQPAGAQTFGWQQYGFRIARDTLFFWVNTFQEDTSGSTQYINWDSRAMPNNTGVVPLPNNRLPQGWQLTTELVTDNSSKVTGFAFSIAQADGTVLNSPSLTLESLNSSFGSTYQLPILNFQVIMVAENVADDGPGDSVTFSAGQGIFLCYETNNLIATAAQDESGEAANTSYSALPASYPNGEFYQLFGIGLSS